MLLFQTVSKRKSRFSIVFWQNIESFICFHSIWLLLQKFSVTILSGMWARPPPPMQKQFYLLSDVDRLNRFDHSSTLIELHGRARLRVRYLNTTGWAPRQLILPGEILSLTKTVFVGNCWLECRKCAKRSRKATVSLGLGIVVPSESKS